MANLVIMESPSKANTVKSYLGSNYKVIASVGHIRDLPKSTLGVDIENDFEAHYINIRGKGDIIKEIKKEAKNANKIFLATDPDREGTSPKARGHTETKRLCEAQDNNTLEYSFLSPKLISLITFSSQASSMSLHSII